MRRLWISLRLLGRDEGHFKHNNNTVRVVNSM